MEPKVSVIIPVYNCEAYLPECIRTLRAQSLREMEFIFVCDASPDNSLALLREAERQDARVRVIAFEKNRGVSAARNAGLDAARGEYVGFCDSDDWIEPEMFETLVDAAEKEHADNVFCRVFKDRESRREDVPLGFADGTVFDAKDIREDLIPAMLSQPRDSDTLPLSGYTPRNLFRREVLSGHRFREDIHYAEDLLFLIESLLDCQRAVAVDRAYYHYRIYSGSVTKHYSPHFWESCKASDDALEVLLSDSPECLRRIGIRRRKMAVNGIRNLCRKDSPYSFIGRIREARRLMRLPEVRKWFSGIRPAAFGLRLGLRLGLVKYRLAFAACFLFSFVFDRT